MLPTPACGQCRHHDPALSVGKPQVGGQKGSKTCPDLSDRPFTAARATGGQGNGRCDGLEDRDPSPDEPAPVVVRIDGRIRAVALRLRGKSIDEPSADNPPKGRQEKKHPSIEGGLGGRKEVPFTGRSRGAVPGQMIHQEMRTHLAEELKHNRSQVPC